ncbi:MAG: SDR family oxidoreductase [Anaerolineales bacterium]
MFSIDLSGHTALVTGAGVRLGRAFALGIAQAGGNVVIHYNHSADPAEQTADSVRELGVEAAVVQADLANADQVERLLPQAAQFLGTVDLLVNSAAIFESANAYETTQGVWQRHIDVNLRAPVFLTRSLALSLEGEPGSVVNLLDWRALRPGTEHFAYTIAKAGLAAATQAMARAYAPNLRVNGLALGAILPPPGAGDEKDDRIISSVPQQRWGTVEETVQAMLFLLAGPEYITGEVLHLDGGRHLV